MLLVNPFGPVQLYEFMPFGKAASVKVFPAQAFPLFEAVVEGSEFTVIALFVANAAVHPFASV